MSLHTPPSGGSGYDDDHRLYRCSRRPRRRRIIIIIIIIIITTFINMDIDTITISSGHHATSWRPNAPHTLPTACHTMRAHWTEACKAGGSVHSHQQVNSSCPFGGHDVHFGSATAAAWSRFLPGMLWGWQWNSSILEIPSVLACCHSAAFRTPQCV